MLVMFLRLLKDLQVGNEEIKEEISKISLFSNNILFEYIKELIAKVFCYAH